MKPKDYKPMTVASAKQAADEAREKGLDDLAEAFDGIADHIAKFNESHEMTIEQARQNLGEDEFWRLFTEQPQ